MLFSPAEGADGSLRAPQAIIRYNADSVSVKRELSRSEAGQPGSDAKRERHHIDNTDGKYAMNFLEKIHVQGFRRLFDVNLRLNALNVIIGANGSGKTSLLDVFSLLAASASGRLKETISLLAGIDANLTNLLAAEGDKARFMAFDLAMPVPGYMPIDYRIAMTPQGVGYEISDETLTQQRDRKPQPFKHIESHHGDVHYFEPTAGKYPRINNLSKTALCQL
jgi:hypothetical protein